MRKGVEYQQSANTLFHFMDNMKWLKVLLKERKIVPRYCVEEFSFLSKKLPSIAFPEKCFCDLYLGKMILHMRKYGKFGIGFNKQWLIKCGVQPVQYLNSNSTLGKKIKKLYLNKLDKYGTRFSWHMYDDAIFEVLKYIKPLKGKMARTGRKVINFHDEREWRYVPQVKRKCKIKPFLYGEDCDEILKVIENDVISKSDEYSIPFWYEDIKYIILPDWDSCRDMCNFIKSDLKCDCHEKMDIIAKIIIYDSIVEDLYYGKTNWNKN